MAIIRTEVIKWSKRIIPVVLGAAGGYAYYYFIGCASGSCPITGNPYISTIYGGIVGVLLIPRGNKGNEGTETRQ